MFDLFVHWCCLDYVWSKKNVNAVHDVTKVCKQISALSQNFIDPKSGHWFILTPDQLYDQYLELFPNLPSDTTKWTIQLISHYYQALTGELRDRMMDNNYFSLLAQNCISSKEESVADLRVFQSHTVRFYKTLTIEEVIIERLMKGNYTWQQSRLTHFPLKQNFQ